VVHADFRQYPIAAAHRRVGQRSRHILEEKRHAGEWPGGWRSRSGPRGFEGLEDNGVDLRVARLNARDRLFYQFARSDLASAHQLGQTQPIIAVEISEPAHVVLLFERGFSRPMIVNDRGRHSIMQVAGQFTLLHQC
jgi:hypothetical protein